MLNATVPPFFNLDPHSLRKGPKRGQKSKKKGGKGGRGELRIFLWKRKVLIILSLTLTYLKIWVSDTFNP